MGPSKQSKIRWTEEEWDLIKESLVETLRKNPRLCKKEAFDTAQEILDPHRQRPLANSALSQPAVQSVWNYAVKESAKVKQATEHVTEEVKERIVYMPVPTPTNAQDLPLHELLSQTILRLLPLFIPSISSIMTPTTADKLTTTETIKKSPYFDWKDTVKVVVPRIGIMSDRKDQFNEIKNRVNQKKVELLWISTDYKPSALPNLDYVMILKYAGHAHRDQAVVSVGSDRVIFIDGGISQVVSRINELYPGSLN